MLPDPDWYQIRVQGHLEAEWSEWFDGLTITWDESDDTILTGQLLDQAALYGLLHKLQDLGVSLLEVRRIASKTGT